MKHRSPKRGTESFFEKHLTFYRGADDHFRLKVGFELLSYCSVDQPVFFKLEATRAHFCNNGSALLSDSSSLQICHDTNSFLCAVHSPIFLISTCSAY